MQKKLIKTTPVDPYVFHWAAAAIGAHTSCPAELSTACVRPVEARSNKLLV